jgi:hypothetical protein
MASVMPAQHVEVSYQPTAVVKAAAAAAALLMAVAAAFVLVVLPARSMATAKAAAARSLAGGLPLTSRQRLVRSCCWGGIRRHGAGCMMLLAGSSVPRVPCSKSALLQECLADGCRCNQGIQGIIKLSSAGKSAILSVHVMLEL